MNDAGQERCVMCLAALAVLAAATVGLCGCAKITEDTAIGHYVRGQTLADAGQDDAALRELALSVKRNPKLSVAHAASGDIHRRRGSYELARRCYELACQTNPYAFKPHYNLGVTYQLLAEKAAAFPQVEGMLQRAVMVYLRAMELRPEDFDTHLNLSACYFQLGKYDLAEQYCLSAIGKNPRSPQAYSNLGTIYDSQNRMYDAIRAYKESLELDVHQPELLMNLAATYLRQNRVKSALATYQTAAREAPDNAHAWQQIGLCHYKLRDYEQSREAYGRAVEIDPANPDALRGIGVIYMTQYVTDRSRTELRDKALAAWHASLEARPDQQDLQTLIEKYTPKVAESPL